MAASFNIPSESFIWGSGGRKLTPEDVARERKIAEAMLAAGIDFSPVAHPLQGFARLAQALSGKIREGRANRAESEGRAGASSAFSSLLSGFGGGSSGNGGNTVSAVSTGSTGGMSSYRDAIASIESAGSGDYQALGPQTKGDRAYGRYQVMGRNVPEWTKAAFGFSMTPDQFLASPEAQDRVFDHVFGGYVDRFGPEGAAQAWFGGPGSVGKTGRKDVLGTDVGSYGQRFIRALGQPTSAPVQVASLDPSAGVAAAAGAVPPVMAPAGLAGASEASAAPIQPVVAPAAVRPSLPVSGLTAAAVNPDIPMAGGRALTPQQQAQAGRFPAAPPPAGVGGGMPGMGALMAVIGNEWASPGQQKIAAALLERQLAEQDPMRRMEMERAQLELERLRNPVGDPFTLSPGQTRFDAQGRPLASGGADTAAPTVQTFYDKEGREYKAQWNQQTGQWDQVGGSKLPSGFAIRTNPDGSVEVVQGQGAKLSENQSKLTLFGSMQAETSPALAQMEEQWNPANLQDAAASAVPIVGNFFKSAEGQQYEALARAWADGALRISTGAAATAAEFDRIKQTYFARPGDTPATIAQKKELRAAFERSLQAAMGKEGAAPNPLTFKAGNEKGRPKVGAVEDGYRFKGGDPSKEENWEKVR